jgi:phosphoenolpyruvate carboxykinase (GTP)
MLPFMGYNAGDYMAHWLEIGRATDAAKLPKLFWVNWFRKGDDGSFLWPGFGENSRVLKWVVERVAGTAEAVDTPIGRVPSVEGIDTDGLEVEPDHLAVLLSVDAEAWRGEVPLIEEHYAFIGDHLPAELRDELNELEKRLAAG